MRWSDGQPFTAADVAFTFGLVFNDSRRQKGKSETSDVLRDTCQNLSDLAMGLAGSVNSDKQRAGTSP